MLGTVDFSAVREFEVIPSDDYDGMTKGWEVKTNNAGDGQYVLVKYTVDYDGMQRTLPDRFSLKPNALWKLKRTLIDLGVDPEALKGEVSGEVLAAILNEIYDSPMPVVLSVGQETYTPAQGEPRLQNVVLRVTLPE